MSTCKKLVNSPVSLESITKHADVSRWVSGVGPIGHSCLLDPASAAARDRRRAAHAARLAPCANGLNTLMRLRRIWVQWKRARMNAYEEAPLAARIEKRDGPGAAYDAGLAVGVPPSPSAELCIGRVGAALRGGLPQELADLCRAWLAQQA